MGDLPRVVVAAPATGQGKTTVATGLMAALAAAGHAVSGHKVGPDYIDPGYHALACGRPGRNLDPHLVGESLVAPLLLHGARGADVAVVEGVMGLYDGRIGGHGFSSTAHVAALTRTPVVLVVDISRASRSIGAVVHGMATWDPTVTVAGVILNQAGSARHAEEVRSSIALPVLGVIPRDASIATPSRHLGLVTAAERGESEAVVARLASVVAEHVDLDAVLAIARSAPALDAHPWSPGPSSSSSSRRSEERAEGAYRGASPRLDTPRRSFLATELLDELGDSAIPPTRRRVAVAAGRAFTFRYAETAELLAAHGCDVVPFDPAVDPALPAGTAGLYLGGGFPEVHAADLAANTALLGQVREAVLDGLPTVAECAGLLYLCRTLDGAPMAGVLAADATMTQRLTLRYPVATAPADTLLTRAGEEVTGHEFHRTTVTPALTGTPAWEIDGDPVGFASETLHASYLHTHWAGHPQLAARFADAVHRG
ncbi:cobyrinate a,c-diamide synthase [Nocardioides daeguensis]|uniref:Hydrogenobyrinate a,c-diamide synthase n=1 Tax=Nocardioides daeguensis TaxID=908359 RepID=A0ABP6VQ57_9ACTN|nr:cobyrinate a,c-diamide synthase [Nocardioides daeguensis]MCR1773274.1 cobyrinate a,c-diamide synthase [Nocardioides daeguensis]